MSPTPQPIPTPATLIGWSQGHPHHEPTVRWLTGITDRRRLHRELQKPEIEAVKALLIDLFTHAPPEVFDLAGQLINSISPCFIMATELAVHRATIAGLHRTARMKVPK